MRNIEPTPIRREDQLHDVVSAAAYLRCGRRLIYRLVSERRVRFTRGRPRAAVLAVRPRHLPRQPQRAAAGRRLAGTGARRGCPAGAGSTRAAGWRLAPTDARRSLDRQQCGTTPPGRQVVARDGGDRPPEGASVSSVPPPPAGQGRRRPRPPGPPAGRRSRGGLRWPSWHWPSCAASRRRTVSSPPDRRVPS